MKFKGLMLAAAAATAATGASAADLPVAPEPVDYVRVCDVYGTGFFYLPGTETCLKIGGRVRTELRFFDFDNEGGSAWDADADVSTGFRARGYFNFDSRTQTEFGLLRTYVDIFATADSGRGDAFSLDKAFIQWGGLTAGRAGSRYDFFTGMNWGSVLNMGFADDGTTNQFSYTAAFGNGFSATVSLEDGLNRRAGILTSAGAQGGFGVTDLDGGHKYPDLVANLRVDQGWGSAQIMGALHHVYVNSAAGSALTADSELGWAIGGGVQFKLPMISSGTSLGFQASYSDGAANYAAASNARTADAVVNAAGTSIATTKSWAIGGGISHAWTSTVKSGLTASYIDRDHGFTVQDSTEWNVQGNVVWSPVRGLDIGAELEYSTVDWNNPVAGGTTFRDDGQLVGVFRIQRTF
ncbi:outer membrane protein [Roseibium aquae]|uniref:Porin n=1 Tax=Roseibium aquae TaxID=1323746 RepID=A0A916X1T4_9HYPH|nr:porin [Roseibium aquae]GGB56340.1 outer membrane protein [Roseibium aquae]